MRNLIGMTTAAALTVTAIAAWATAPTRTDLDFLGSITAEAGINPAELTLTVSNLPVQEYDGF
jgi:hypothetical protein